jgi:hypothetical protein
MFIMFLERKIVHDSPYMGQICRPDWDESAFYEFCNAKRSRSKIDGRLCRRRYSRDIDFPWEGSGFQSLGRGRGTAGKVIMSPMMNRVRFLQDTHSQVTNPFSCLVPKKYTVGKCLAERTRDSTRILVRVRQLDMFRPVAVMAAHRGKALHKPAMCDKLPPGSKVLSALDTYDPTMDLWPDEDGVIDLTTPVNDTLFEAAVKAQLTTRHTPSADS